MTDTDMFIDYEGKIKTLKQKLRLSKNISNDLEVIIESQKKEIDTLKQIISLQELQSQTTEKKMKTRTDKIFQLKSILMKCREKGKFELAMKLIDKYKIDKETLEEKYYD
jgi:hypothetical protein